MAIMSTRACIRSGPTWWPTAIPPDYALSSHVAPLGLTFSMGSALPEPYASGAFVGEHGSWNRTFFNGYKVVYVPFQNGKPAGKAQDVVTGFIDGDQAHGRPVGLAIDGTGALLIADDVGNTVWRVAAADGSVTPQPIGTDQLPGSNSASATPESSGATTAGQADGTAPVTGSADGAQAGQQLTDQEPSASREAGSPVPPQTEIAPASLPSATGPQD